MNQIFFKNDDAATGIVAFKCAIPTFFNTDNCLLYMNAPYKSAIYLQFTALFAAVFDKFHNEIWSRRNII